MLLEGDNMYKKRYVKKSYKFVLLFLLSFITVGYAYLNSSIEINGYNKIDVNRWDIHFENILKVDGSVGAELDASIKDGTTITFNVNLIKPADFYSFSVDVVNVGTMDAMLSQILKTGIIAEQERFFNYDVTYIDGAEILEKDSLPSGRRDTLLISVKYRDDIVASDLPLVDQNIDLSLDAIYVQDDGTSDNRRPLLYLYDEIVSQNKEDGIMVLDNMSSNYVSTSTGINFNLAPSDTNGNGVYIRNGTENDKYPIYYYRGEVDNNNVIFSNFCWKIVRTTETGGIKLVYNGIPSNGTCNNTGTFSQLESASVFNSKNDYNAQVGYMHGTPNASNYDLEHLSVKGSTSSTIKTKIDTWYSKNLLSYEHFLEDTIWCNNRSFASNNSGTGVGTSTTYYASVTSVYNNNNIQPNLNCINKNDRFTVNEKLNGRLDGNGALTYPVALLTVDELTLAGNGYKGYSNKNYLSTGQSWWSLSPYRYLGDPYGLYVKENGSLYMSYVGTSLGVRPAISLKNRVVISSIGDGSMNSPFIIEKIV